MVIGLLLIFSGFSNMIIMIIKTKPQKVHKYWKYMLYAKFILTLFITPLFDLLYNAVFTSSDSTEEDLRQAKLWIHILKLIFICLIMAIAVYSRYFREVVVHNFKLTEREELSEHLNSNHYNAL